MIRIIFCDTNKLFGAFRYFFKNGCLDNSSLKELTSGYKVFVSTFVVFELYDISVNKISKIIDHKHIKNFFSYLEFNVIQSKKLESRFLQYVSDPDDAQILQDAIDCKSDIILTSNLQDFNIDQIFKKFSVSIVNKI